MDHELILSDHNLVMDWLGSAGFQPGALHRVVGETSRTWTDDIGRSVVVQIKLTFGGPNVVSRRLLTNDTALAMEIKLAVPEAFQ